MYPPPTASASVLRPSVLFRNVTDSLRSEPGAQTYAGFRSVVSGATPNSHSVFHELRCVLAIPSFNKVATYQE